LSQLPNIQINANAVKAWLSQRKNFPQIATEIDDILSAGLDVSGLDKVNVNTKLEARMKDKIEQSLTCDFEDDNGMPETIEEQRIRLIVWQQKGITALFAPMFAQAKEHLKRCLNDNVLYTDGMTPAELSTKLSQIQVDEIYFVEDDLKKQDRQTDATLIETEMNIYKALGCNPSLVDMWHVVHMKWRAKGMMIKFKGDATRQTGQASTAIGNLIVNFTTHMGFVERLGKHLKMMLGLGDDNAFITSTPVTTNDVKLNSARHFNMVSDPFISKDYAGYLRMLIYVNPLNGNRLEIGPDIVRMRLRFEVLNKSGNVDQLAIDMRCMSYLAMIGSTEETERIVKKKQWPIKLSMWYNMSALMHNLALKYKSSVEKVNDQLNLLLYMIEFATLIKNEKLMPVELQRG
jgi:hypothetical protein